MSLKLLQLTATAAALASTVHGLAVPQSEGASSFSLNAYPRNQPELFDPEAELHRLLSKYPTVDEQEDKTKRADYGKPPPSPKKQHGSVKAKPVSSGQTYLVPTVIGNQTFDLIFDTGSSDLWVYSNESSPFQSLGHPTYAPTSSAKLLPGYTWSIKYAFGSEASGVVYTDTVKFGSVVAHNQSVEAATVVQFEFSSDGIVGLANGVLNQVKPIKQKTLFETLMPTLERKLFAANLRNDGKPSTWDFGYIDKSKFKGDITYAPVSGDQKYWQVDVGSYAVGKSPFTGKNDTIGTVIVDSGTSLVYLPEAVVNNYYSHIKGFELTQGGSYTFPCNSTIPDLHFKLQNTPLTIPGSAINSSMYDPNAGTCAGALSSQLNMRYSVLGNLFMRYYYVIHSQEDGVMKMGFASH